MITAFFIYGIVNLIIAAYFDMRVINPGRMIKPRRIDLFAYIVLMLFFGLPVAGLRLMTQGLQ